jgi:Ca2+-binding RTX toxin-like protein
MRSSGREDACQLEGHRQCDRVVDLQGADRAIAGGGNDFVCGGPGHDDGLNGSAGADQINGGAGQDELQGHTGPDRLIYGESMFGEEGDDYLRARIDPSAELDGGEGTDTCVGDSDDRFRSTCELVRIG